MKKSYINKSFKTLLLPIALLAIANCKTYAMNHSQQVVIPRKIRSAPRNPQNEVASTHESAEASATMIGSRADANNEPTFTLAKNFSFTPARTGHREAASIEPEVDELRSHQATSAGSLRRLMLAPTFIYPNLDHSQFRQVRFPGFQILRTLRAKNGYDGTRISLTPEQYQHITSLFSSRTGGISQLSELARVPQNIVCEIKIDARDHRIIANPFLTVDNKQERSQGRPFTRGQELPEESNEQDDQDDAAEDERSSEQYLEEVD